MAGSRNVGWRHRADRPERLRQRRLSSCWRPANRAPAPPCRSTRSNWKAAMVSCGSIARQRLRRSWPSSVGRSGTWPIDPDRTAVPHPGSHRGDRRPQGDRRVSAVMPGEAGRRSFFRSRFHLPHAPENRHQIIGIRWPGLLDRYQTLVEREFPLVAHGHGTSANAACPSGADAAA